jgi:ABC-type multidrug transport system ATPase subunit
LPPVRAKALTVRSNLDLHARLWGIPPSAAASKITELAGWAILITAAAIRVFTRSAVN